MGVKVSLKKKYTFFFFKKKLTVLMIELFVKISTVNSEIFPHKMKNRIMMYHLTVVFFFSYGVIYGRSGVKSWMKKFFLFFSTNRKLLKKKLVFVPLNCPKSITLKQSIRKYYQSCFDVSLCHIIWVSYNFVHFAFNTTAIRCLTSKMHFPSRVLNDA